MNTFILGSHLVRRKQYVWLAVLVFTFLVVVFAPRFASAQTVSTVPLCEITRTLRVGSQGEDVRCLQRYLNWAGFSVATSGAGSPGNETMFYGSRTAAAVSRWQESNAATVLAPLGLSSGTGNWGPASFARYVMIVKAALGVS